MKQIISFIKKEFYHITRDTRTIIILLIMPIVQIIIYGFALSNEVKNSQFAVIDYSQTTFSKQLIRSLDASKYFNLYQEVSNPAQMEKLFQQNKIKMGLVIPENITETMYSNTENKIQLLIDGADPNTGNTILAYANQIINGFLQSTSNNLPFLLINPEIRYLYNPQLLSSFNYVPGVMAMILMLVSTMMTAVSIVKEKELGTMEIILVSPLKPLKVIIAKMVPYFLISFVNIINIILISVFVLHLPIKGNIFVLMLESSLFIITCLSFGFFISTKAEKQETAMFMSLIGLFLPTLMLSGYMFPIENLPIPLKIISNIVPARWYYSILKAVMIKGLGFESIWLENIVLIAMTIGLLAMSKKNFKMRLE